MGLCTGIVIFRSKFFGAANEFIRWVIVSRLEIFFPFHELPALPMAITFGVADAARDACAVAETDSGRRDGCSFEIHSASSRRLPALDASRWIRAAMGLCGGFEATKELKVRLILGCRL